MDIRFAKRMQGLRASEIRELLKHTQNPEVISFAGGLPAAELFPVPELASLAHEIVLQEGCRVLQYSTTEGDPGLRRAIAGRMKATRGIEAAAEGILVTCGSQQGVDLTGKLFLDEGDAVLCESPTYIGAINAFRAYRPRFVEVPTDEDGMVIPELERLLEGEPAAKLIYVVPDFQNPSGRRWSWERRCRFMEVVRRFRVPVVEDAPYAELNFEGTPLPALKSLDENGLVIYLGTFSKILCPGLRIGWLFAEPSLFEKYVLAKQGADLHTSSFTQRLIGAYMERYDLDANVLRIREAYRHRRDAMIETMEQVLPAGVNFTRPGGGLFLWAELPPELNARALLALSLKRQVAFVPGGAFFPNGGHENTLRLNFSAMPEERIEEGVRRLGGVIRAALERPEEQPDRPAAAVSA